MTSPKVSPKTAMCIQTQQQATTLYAWAEGSHFGSFTYGTQMCVICVTMAVALWCFSLAVECPLLWHGELRAERTQTSAAALTRDKGFAALS